MDSPEINFFSEGTDFVYDELEQAKGIVNMVLAEEKTWFAEVNVIFCSDNEIKRINKAFLNKDQTTDVISFDMESELAITEIYIGIDQVEKNSRYFNETFENELNRVLIHGLLHLCGYNDYTEHEKKEMKAKENFYLQKSQIGFT
ncbi:MAG: rRNA maturation RNase YbeY [Bacteroidales bacterium]|nr:rRNA maturation RNase YbeY [Bacteroidales bacterium]MCF8345560.1 rRNA maturation RNase YbeY [Bacteroidales bacterium]MCF8350727.1 rRNA maturation RNase YbeY [Bacteroidales bacterium]MCF8376314.1 rRNA maturation RNase YbeY [Bacteroidales bacterium]MCF8401007.1 rRNA maturation RNase YbeY [Bacteroidales bacterium]